MRRQALCKNDKPEVVSEYCPATSRPGEARESGSASLAPCETTSVILNVLRRELLGAPLKIGCGYAGVLIRCWVPRGSGSSAETPDALLCCSISTGLRSGGSDTRGAGALPLVCTASYWHCKPRRMHVSHGWSPEHFDFLALQTSQARVTFTKRCLRVTSGALRFCGMALAICTGGFAAPSQLCTCRTAADTQAFPTRGRRRAKALNEKSRDISPGTYEFSMAMMVRVRCARWPWWWVRDEKSRNPITPKSDHGWSGRRHLPASRGSSDPPPPRLRSVYRNRQLRIPAEQHTLKIYSPRWLSFDFA